MTRRIPDDEELVEAVLRGTIDDLTDFVDKRYGR